MKPNDLNKITNSAVAPSLRRLRSGASLGSHDYHNEVLPQNYGTYKKESSWRGPQSLLNQTDSHSERRAQRSQPRRDGRHRTTGQPLRDCESLAAIPRSATFVMGSNGIVSVNRRGNETRQGVGEEEADIVTGSGREERCGRWQKFSDEYRGSFRAFLKIRLQISSPQEGWLLS